MTKYKLTDLKVGAVFKESDGARTIIRTIITVGKADVFYHSKPTFGYVEDCASIDLFLSGHYGELVVPTKKLPTLSSRVTTTWYQNTIAQKRIGTVE